MNDSMWSDILGDDQKGLKSLYDQYFDNLYSFGCSFYSDQMLVEDCIQELFLSIWEKRHQQNLNEMALADRIGEQWMVVVNPNAGSRKGEKDWPKISELLNKYAFNYDFVFTENRKHDRAFS